MNRLPTIRTALAWMITPYREPYARAIALQMEEEGLELQLQAVLPPDKFESTMKLVEDLTERSHFSCRIDYLRAAVNAAVRGEEW